LTVIDRKMGRGEALTSEELAFLYAVDKPIKYFGVKQDPRIEELRNQRDAKKDIPVFFHCKPSQIAHNVSEIQPDTTAYVGALEPGIFERLTAMNITNIYTSFPGVKILIQSIIMFVILN